MLNFKPIKYTNPVNSKCPQGLTVKRVLDSRGSLIILTDKSMICQVPEDFLFFSLRSQCLSPWGTMYWIAIPFCIFPLYCLISFFFFFWQSMNVNAQMTVYPDFYLHSPGKALEYGGGFLCLMWLRENSKIIYSLKFMFLFSHLFSPWASHWNPPAWSSLEMIKFAYSTSSS